MNNIVLLRMFTTYLNLVSAFCTPVSFSLLVDLSSVQLLAPCARPIFSELSFLFDVQLLSVTRLINDRRRIAHLSP